MVAAAEVGGSVSWLCEVWGLFFDAETLRRGGKRRVFSLLALAFLTVPVHAATFYVTLTGLGGEPDYVQRFKMLADDIDSSLKKAGGDSTVVTMVAPTREQVRSRFAEIDRQAKPADAVVVMLIGHGTYDGVEYK